MKLTTAIITRIRELLKKDHLTQYQLFKSSGVAQSTISSILKGKVNTIKLETLFDICFGLNIELDEFFSCDYFKFDSIDR